MNALARGLLRVVESIVYGPVYGTLAGMIRNPKPIDPEPTWKYLTRKLNPIHNWVAFNYPPKFMRKLLIKAKMKQDHVLGIAEHYDVSNEFYELFLDKEYMFYTCADYHDWSESLETAQIRKANRFIELIQPHAGEKILELGPGWGPMLNRIYEETGDKENLYGYTLSKEQMDYNAQHGQFNMEFRNFITTDYPANYFDKVYSVESFEHVRPEDYPTLAKKLFHTLKPGGIGVHQVSLRMNETVPTTATSVQLFFPGSLAASYGHMFRTFEAAGFKFRTQDILDYRPTLRAWFDRIVANKEKVWELVGVETYNRYLLMCAVSWRWLNLGWGQTVRVVMQKPHVHSRNKVEEPELVHA